MQFYSKPAEFAHNSKFEGHFNGKKFKSKKGNSSFFSYKIHEAIRYLIKVCNDLVEQSEALKTLLVYVGFCVELFEVRDRSKHHTHQVI